MRIYSLLGNRNEIRPALRQDLVRHIQQVNKASLTRNCCVPEYLTVLISKFALWGHFYPTDKMPRAKPRERARGAELEGAASTFHLAGSMSLSYSEYACEGIRMSAWVPIVKARRQRERRLRTEVSFLSSRPPAVHAVPGINGALPSTTFISTCREQ